MNAFLICMWSFTAAVTAMCLFQIFILTLGAVLLWKVYKQAWSVSREEVFLTSPCVCGDTLGVQSK